MRAQQILKMAAAGMISLGTLVGCSSNAGTGALAGGAAGAGLGAVIGHNSHGNTAGGAIVGGALGAVTGAIVGSEMDRQQREREDREYYGDRGYYERRYYDEGPYYSDRYYPAPPYYEVRRYDPYTGTTYIERHYSYRAVWKWQHPAVETPELPGSRSPAHICGNLVQVRAL